MYLFLALIEVEDCSSLRETQNETTVLADHQGDLVGSEAPFAIHFSFLFLKFCALAQGTNQFFLF
jgi:hypothetical protein